MKTYYDLELDQMTEGYLQLSKAYKWELDFYKQIIVLWHVVNHRKVESSRIQGLLEHIKASSSHEDPLRKALSFPIAGLLCANADLPEYSFDRMLEMEHLLHTNGYTSPTFKPISTYVLSQLSTPNTMDAFLEEARKCFKDLANMHPFFIKADDFPIAVMMAAAHMSAKTLDSYYQEMIHHGFTQSIGLMWLSYIAALSHEEPYIIARRCHKIDMALAGNALKLSRKYDAAIGIIALQGDDVDRIISELVNIEKHMKRRKGFKWLGKDMWVMIASTIIADNELSGAMDDKYYLSLATMAVMTSVMLAMSLELVHY